jgi:hypothetical protein
MRAVRWLLRIHRPNGPWRLPRTHEASADVRSRRRPLPALAVNIFLITQVTGLAQAFHFAGRHGLDHRSQQVIGGQ